MQHIFKVGLPCMVELHFSVWVLIIATEHLQLTFPYYKNIILLEIVSEP